MFPNRRVTLAILFFVALTTPVVARSQFTPDAIRARLKGRPLYIRNFWSDETLYFDGSGNLTAPTKRSTFTLAGFSFSSITLQDGVLTISGKPVGIEFENAVPKRVDLPFAKRTIKITAPVNGNFGPALDAIFADGIEALAPTLPDYWQPWARKKYPTAFTTGALAQESATSASASTSLTKMGRSVSAPRLLQRTEAKPSDAAEGLRYGNPPLIDLIVGADGKPTQLSIARPSGLGLDEAALVSVQDWRFAPAKEHGQPVRTEINVEYSFPTSSP